MENIDNADTQSAQNTVNSWFFHFFFTSFLLYFISTIFCLDPSAKNMTSELGLHLFFTSLLCGSFFMGILAFLFYKRVERDIWFVLIALFFSFLAVGGLSTVIYYGKHVLFSLDDVVVLKEVFYCTFYFLVVTAASKFIIGTSIGKTRSES